MTRPTRNIPAIAAGLIRDSVEYECSLSTHEQRGGAEWTAFVAELTPHATAVSDRRERDGTWVAAFVGSTAEGRPWCVLLIDTSDVWNVSQRSTVGGSREG